MNKAACKRAFTLGSRWAFQYRLDDCGEDGRYNEGAWSKEQFREVCHIQSNAIAFAKAPELVEAARANPHRSATWLHFDGTGSKWKSDGIAVEIQDIRTTEDIQLRRQRQTIRYIRRA